MFSYLITIFEGQFFKNFEHSQSPKVPEIWRIAEPKIDHLIENGYFRMINMDSAG